MRKIMLTIAMTALVSSVSAKDVKFSNADGSAHTDICIAAATSDAVLKAKIKEHKYSDASVRNLSCNGLTIEKFARKYHMNTSSKAVKVFSFDNSMGNVEADICIAAASSNESYKALKAKLSKSKEFYRTISCNNKPIAAFAKKFGNKKFKI
ncbi:MAG: hypothetical protein HRT52_06120 [Colwellia sp.]|nr:hypothetical protein [Colwellia sp.]